MKTKTKSQIIEANKKLLELGLAEFKQTEQYKTLEKCFDIVLIHNPYYDNEVYTNSFIVIVRNSKNSFSIYRYFYLGEKLQVSIDYSDLNDYSVIFKILLTEYSSGLN